MAKDAEITFECNVSDLEDSKLEFLSHYVNRLSIGVQTFNSKFIKILGRKSANLDRIEKAKRYFDNINVDLMYGFGLSIESLIFELPAKLITISIL